MVAWGLLGDRRRDNLAAVTACLQALFEKIVIVPT